MKKLLIPFAALIMTACASTSENPFFAEWNTPFGIPPFEEIKYEHYLPALEAGMAEQNEQIASIVACTDAPTFENVIVPMEFSGATLSKVIGVLFNLSESMNSPRMQEIVEKALPALSEHSDNIYMNPELFAKVKAVYEADQSGLSREQQMVLKKIYEQFENNGIGLPEDKQARLREINSQLASIEQKFASNLLSENNAYKAAVGSSISEYYEKMGTIEDRDLRKKMFYAYSTRCSHGNEYDNNELVLQTLRLKQEKAVMLGYSSPAAWILHNKMAKTPEAVDAFLKGIMKAAVDKANLELSDMMALFSADFVEGKIKGEPMFNPWDWMYYAQKVKQSRYAINEEEVKEYFPMEKVRAGVFSAANKLYGVSFKKIEDCPKYHPEVEGFEVIDADGSLIGVILTDYFPRESKRGGAWMSNVRDQIVIDGTDIRPIIVNVGNFNKPVDGKPALMSIDDVETMFHEFGHALHGLLSKCTYPSVSGTNTARDFVELPSQINENWAFQPELLNEYARHYKTDEPIPGELVEKILATRTFNQGFKTTELCAASILDMKWHELTSIPEDADAEWVQTKEKEFCEEMGLIGEIIPRYRSTYFNHIFGSSGYSAGYYSYLWAEVLDKDAFQAFVREGIFNPETGRRFRDCILSRGSSEEPMTLYRQFTGADPDPEYLLYARGLK